MHQPQINDFGNYITISPKTNVTIQEKLAPGAYNLHCNMMGYYLEKREPYQAPKKIYGNLETKVDRILDNWLSRNEGTGALASGIKGAGKTLFNELISIKAEHKGIPTLVISTALYGPSFNSFLQSIEQPCIVLVDEFEKRYTIEQQQELLTVLDGGDSSNKLFIFATNCVGEKSINTFLVDRPGRIRYHLRFDGLDHDFVKDYLAENLDFKEHESSLAILFSLVKTKSFDSLQALVSEVNISKENPWKAIKWLNISLLDLRKRWDCKVAYQGGVIKSIESIFSLMSDETVYFSLKHDDPNLDIVKKSIGSKSYRHVKTKTTDSYDFFLNFNPKTISKYDPKTCETTHKFGEITLTCKPIEEQGAYDYELLDKPPMELG